MTVDSTQKKYEAPAIVYEGRISTRAGSPRSSADQGGTVDLFGQDE